MNTVSVVRKGKSPLEGVRIFGIPVTSFFQPKERRTKTMSVRITPSLEARLGLLARLWTIASRAHAGDETPTGPASAMPKSKGGEDEKSIGVTPNDAAFRVMDASIDAAISEMLGTNTKRPENEADWKAVEAAIRKRFGVK